MLRSSDTRGQSDSEKWHKYAGTNILPMWVADTEFLAAPAILDALQERLEHGVFGYGHRRQRFLDAIKKHCHDQYGWHIEDDWIQPLTGVVPGLNFSRAVAQLRGKNQAVIDEDIGLQIDGLPESEHLANKAAADFCVPAAKLDSYIVRVGAYIFSERKITAFAGVNEIHPGLVVGQLHNRTGKYQQLRKHLVPVRNFILNGSTYDGWGFANRSNDE